VHAKIGLIEIDEVLDQRRLCGAMRRLTMQQRNRTTFGLRQTHVMPQTPLGESRGRWSFYLMIFILALTAFFIVGLLGGNTHFYYQVKVSYPSSSSSFDELLQQCGGKASTSPNVQLSSCTKLIESGRGNQHGLSIAYYNRGNAYLATSHFDHAIADYNRAIELNPGLVSAFNNRGRAFLEKDQIDRAVADFEEVIRLNPNSAAALHSRCWARAISGHLADALSDCTASLRIRPNDAVTLNTRGFVELKSGAFDQAIIDFDAALKSAPNMVGATKAAVLYGRGLAKQRRGSPGASDDIAAAKAINPAVAAQYARYGL
jgi:tetratricopeptide (TPR) repeat protein